MCADEIQSDCLLPAHVIAALTETNPDCDALRMFSASRVRIVSRMIQRLTGCCLCIICVETWCCSALLSTYLCSCWVFLSFVRSFVRASPGYATVCLFGSPVATVFGAPPLSFTTHPGDVSVVGRYSCRHGCVRRCGRCHRCSQFHLV